MANLEIRNPATNQQVAIVEATGPSALISAAERARQAQKNWSRLSFSDRAEVATRFHDLIIRRADLVMDTIQSETGKSRRDAWAEVVTAVGTTRYYLAHGERFLAPRRRKAAVPLLTQSLLLRRPHGLVGLITPWNYPFLLGVGDILPALLAGNGVLIKPSELTPLSTLLARDMLQESGLDPDLVTVVNGGGDTGRALIDLVDYVAFTGGTITGRKVALAAADRLIPYSLELGGKNPMIVLKEAPLRNAANALVAGAFSNAGQTCISIERVYVESPVFERFAELVVEGAKRLRVGWSKAFDMDVGSMIREERAARVGEVIDGAVRNGASILAGGQRRADLGPAFVEPTVLARVNRHDPIAVEETFGPVVSLHRVRNREEALELANDSVYGLNASVWAGSRGSAMEVAEQIQAGSVAINSSLMIYNAFDVPMGGIKLSGVGRRHAEQGIQRFTQTQSIVQSFEAGGGYDNLLTRIDDAGIAAKVLRLVGLLRRVPGLR